MLGQLLAQHGVVTRRVSHKAGARDAVSSLDLTGVVVLAVSYLELGGSPAHLRSLVRRLRQRAPKATILVGLWPPGEAVWTDPAIQQALGADRYAGSLRQAVDECLSVVSRPGHAPSPLEASQGDHTESRDS